MSKLDLKCFSVNEGRVLQTSVIMLFPFSINYFQKRITNNRNKNISILNYRTFGLVCIECLLIFS